MDFPLALQRAAAIVYGAEGYKSVAFLDTLAVPPVWTIGHGTTRVNGEPVFEGMTCTLAQANVWAASDMANAAHYVVACVHVPINEWQLGALTSFTYNLGFTGFRDSTVLEALNEGRYQACADRLLEYDEAGGKDVLGLDTRRGRERAIFMVGMGTYVSGGLFPLVRPAAPAVLPAISADTLNADELAGTPIPGV